MTMGPLRDLGPAIVLWNAVDLGRSKGGITFRYTEEDAPVFEDQLGTSSVDDIQVGNHCEVGVPLSRMALSSLTALLAGASGSGTSGATMTVKAVIGESRYDRAQELILKPILLNGLADPTTSRWLHIFKASPKADFELPYNNADQRAYNFLFRGYMQQTGVPALQIWRTGPAIA